MGNCLQDDVKPWYSFLALGFNPKRLALGFFLSFFRLCRVDEARDGGECSCSEAETCRCGCEYVHMRCAQHEPRPRCPRITVVSFELFSSYKARDNAPSH